MAAFVGALLCQASDRTAWLSAIMADRYQKPATIIIATIIALVAGNSLAVIIPAILAGENRYRTLPHRPIRLAIGIVLIVTGIAFGLGALRLV